MLVFGSILIVAMNLLKGSDCPLYSLDKVTSLIKLLPEQSDQFSGQFIKSMPFQFLICGTPYCGLVLSNAFKSTNAYNISLPKKFLKFIIVDELLLHGLSVYSRLARPLYFLISLTGVPQSTQAVINSDNAFTIMTNEKCEIIYFYCQVYMYKSMSAKNTDN